MRPTEQKDSCTKRDLDWLQRIRRRALGNTDRSSKDHKAVVDALNLLVGHYQKDVDAILLREREEMQKAQRRARKAG